MLTREQLHFVQLTAGIWCGVLAGINNAFGILSNEMKDQFDLKQTDMTTISTIGMAVNLFSLPSGFLYDKWGPRAVNAVATVLMALGFVGNALIFTKVIPGSTLTLAVCTVLSFSTGGWFEVGTLMTNLYNFPRNRGEIIILQQTFMGLGAALFSVVYSAFFEGDYTGYSLFVAGFVLLVGGFSILTIKLPPGHSANSIEEPSEGDTDASAVIAVNAAAPESCTSDDVLDLDNLDARRFNVGLVVMSCNLVLLLCVSVIHSLFDMPTYVTLALGVLTIVLFLSFAALPLLPNRRATVTEQAPLLDNASVWQCDGVRVSQHTRHSAASPPFGNTPRMKPQAAPGSPSDAHPDDELLQHLTPRTFMESLRGARLWLLWLVAVAMGGTYLTVMLNLSQIYRAANDNVYVDRTNAMYVALTGVSGALGRLSVGFLERVIRQKLGIAHIVRLLPLPPLLMMLSSTAFLYVPAKVLVLPFVMTAFAYGANVAVMVLLSRVVFVVDVGKCYNFIYLGTLTGLLIFNRGMFGTFYEREGDAQGLSPECAGLVCYRVTFIALSLALFCAFLAAAVFVRNWLQELRSLRFVVHDTS